MKHAFYWSKSPIGLDRNSSTYGKPLARMHCSTLSAQRSLVDGSRPLALTMSTDSTSISFEPSQSQPCTRGISWDDGKEVCTLPRRHSPITVLVSNRLDSNIQSRAWKRFAGARLLSEQGLARRKFTQPQDRPRSNFQPRCHSISEW